MFGISILLIPSFQTRVELSPTLVIGILILIGAVVLGAVAGILLVYPGRSRQTPAPPIPRPAPPISAPTPTPAPVATPPETIPVYVSYRQLSSAVLAQVIAHELAAHAIDALIDTRAGETSGFPARLFTEIESRAALICLIDAETLNSPWVMREIEHAHAQHKPLIPVYHAGYTPAPPPNDSTAALLSAEGITLPQDEDESPGMRAAIQALADRIRAVRQ